MCSTVVGEGIVVALVVEGHSRHHRRYNLRLGILTFPVDVKLSLLVKFEALDSWRALMSEVRLSSLCRICGVQILSKSKRALIAILWMICGYFVAI